MESANENLTFEILALFLPGLNINVAWAYHFDITYSKFKNDFSLREKIWLVLAFGFPCITITFNHRLLFLEYP